MQAQTQRCNREFDGTAVWPPDWMSGRSAQQVLARRADLVDLRYTDVAPVSVVSALGPLSGPSSSSALGALGIGQ